MKTPIIAMTHEAGSQGKEVALQVAEKLGLKLACHRAFEQHVADRLHADGGMVHRFLQGKPGLIERWKTDQEALAAYTREQVYELAVEGGVLICGWGATTLLRPVAHALCVRICAPLAHRLEVLRAQLGIGEEEALAKIAANDAARTMMMRALGQGEDHHAFVYDLVLNSARVPVAECADEIIRLAGEPALRETAESRALLAALYREAQVRAALRADAATSRVGPWVRVTADPLRCRVALDGVVHTHDQKRDTERVVAGLAWVANVENHLRVVGNAP
jgi:cytidylate kinase